MKLKKITGINLTGKRVLLRADLNVPRSNGRIDDDSRIKRIYPTIKYLKENGAKIILISHLGRPNGSVSKEFSLEFLQNRLEKVFGTKVIFHHDCIDENASKLSHTINPGEILLLENLRFHEGEENNSEEFAQSLSKLGDVYVNDAFACSHRAHASIVGITKFLDSYAGMLLIEEIENLEKFFNDDESPITAIIGGKKVSSKFNALSNLASKVDYLIVGGGMANTFLKAQGHEIGDSFYEPKLLHEVSGFIEIEKRAEIILPTDFICLTSSDSCKIRKISKIQKDEKIFDLGRNSIFKICEILDKSKKVIWNGPVGFFEDIRFAGGSHWIARHIAELAEEDKIKSLAGGGDVISAIRLTGLFEYFSYISTGGGAFLEWLEGNDLPGIRALKR